MDETCTIAACTEPAVRRIEVRREATDEIAAEVRPCCADPLCERIARQSAADFDVRTVEVL